MAILSMESKVHSSVGETTIYKLFNDATTGTSDVIDVRGAKGVSMIVETDNNTVAGGAVELEGAVSSAYAGDWVPLGSVTPVQNDAEACSVSGSANPESNAAGLPMPYVRARFSTNISGGAKADVYIVVEK